MTVCSPNALGASQPGCSSHQVRDLVYDRVDGESKQGHKERVCRKEATDAVMRGGDNLHETKRHMRLQISYIWRAVCSHSRSIGRGSMKGMQYVYHCGAVISTLSGKIGGVYQETTTNIGSNKLFTLRGF